MPELKRSTTLSKGEVDLRVGNGVKIVVLAIEISELTLPSWFIIRLENCYYVHAINMKLIFSLKKFDFSFIIKNKY